MLDRLVAAGFAVALIDITSDIGIPTYLALLADERDPLGHPGMGSACHPVAATALLKALLEAVQVRTSYIAGARDDLDPDEFGAAGRRIKDAGSNGSSRRRRPARTCPSVRQGWARTPLDRSSSCSICWRRAG